MKNYETTHIDSQRVLFDEKDEAAFQKIMAALDGHTLGRARMVLEEVLFIIDRWAKVVYYPPTPENAPAETKHSQLQE